MNILIDRVRVPLASAALAGALLLALVPASALAGDHPARKGAQFERLSTFLVCENTSCDRSVVETTVSEIVAASEDGRTLIYTDSAQGLIGLVDITNAAQPKALGVVDVGGEPTSVAVAGRYALVAVNTSEDFLSPSGWLKVFDIHACVAQIQMCVPLREIDMEGQPDSVAVSPDRGYAAVAIENERDEDQVVDGVEGGLPQLPGGFLQIVDLKGRPSHWDRRRVELTGLSEYAPEDPEAEYVAINRANIAAVTLQENNHIVLVHLPSGKVLRDFPAGQVSLQGIDTVENKLIELNSGFEDRPREPDAIAWLGTGKLITADEGDLFGGTRGWTVFGPSGQVLGAAGTSFEYLAIRHGHYPEQRADAKGAEPEGVAVARYGATEYAFVGSERGNFVAVYRVRGMHLAFVQLLPTGIGPEGLLAIPQRNLFVTASEEDGSEPGEIRSMISIFRLQGGAASYPDIVSASVDGKPIPWGALSALAADQDDRSILYTGHDAFYANSRIYTLDVSRDPAIITAELPLVDDAGQPLSYDLEGLAQRAGGGFWAVSEGAGTSCNAADPATRRRNCNILLRISAAGVVEEEIFLPDAVNAKQRSNGFEGVAVTGSGADEKVYVAFQREWIRDPVGKVRIGVYSAADGWKFLYYPLDPSESPAGGWVGLSELTALGDDRFAVLERDNQGGPDARIKRLYVVSLAGLTPVAEGAGEIPTIAKTLARPDIDLLPYLQSTNGYVLDKPEGFAVARDGKVYFNTDNDGVDDALGESRLFRLGKILE